MHASTNLAEAARLMVVCNSCRYCEGLCAVFPAMEFRHSFRDADLNYLANLCHSCGACYADCQFAPPHEFNVNVPQVLAKVRADSYRSYAWPSALQPLFDRNGLVLTLALALGVSAFILGFALWHDPAALLQSGSFYKLMPHNVMAGLFLFVSAFVVVALLAGFRNFWRDVRAPDLGADGVGSIWQALKDVTTLRYLDGGGVGCYHKDERPNDWRRLFHHLMFYGFMLCFASTASATVLHYVFAKPAPYTLFEIPKLFGIPGGIGLVIGGAGLLWSRLARDPVMTDTQRLGMDTAFIAMLLLSGLTGLLLFLFRETLAMGVLLALHLGVILALFVTMPYSKFVHGLYRLGALVLYALERKTEKPATV